LDETISPLSESYNPNHCLRGIAVGPKYPSLGILFDVPTLPPLSKVSWLPKHPLFASGISKLVRLTNHPQPLASLTRWSILIQTPHDLKHL
jgi:hypothetical protein